MKEKGLILFGLGLGLLALCVPAASRELAVNTSVEGDQRHVVAERGGDGRVAMVWTSEAAGTVRVMLRLLSPVGTPESEEITVHEGADLGRADLAIAGDGSILVVFATGVAPFRCSGGRVLARRYDGRGKPLGGVFFVDSGASPTALGHCDPRAAGAPDGSFAVIWVVDEPDSYDPELDCCANTDVWGRIFEADGSFAGPERLLGNVGDEDNAADVVALPGGRFFASFEPYLFEPSFFDCFGTLFDRQQVSAPIMLNPDDDEAPAPQMGCRLAVGDERLAVVWESGFPASVFLRFFDLEGRPLSEEAIEVARRLPGRHEEPVVAMSDSGELLVAWTSQPDFEEVGGGDGDRSGIFARRYSSQGEPRGAAFQVNLLAEGIQEGPSVLSLASDTYLVSWSDGPAFPGDPEWRPRGRDGDGFGIVARTLRSDCEVGPACLDGRFEIEVTWRDFERRWGVGEEVAAGSRSSAFWFFEPSSYDLVVKVLDGSRLNSHSWLFLGSATNVEYAVAVTDHETGTERLLFNPAGRFASSGDTAAFPDPSSGSAGITAAATELATGNSASRGACVSDTSVLCLKERFAVAVEWRDFAGEVGSGTAVPGTTASGFFWFFDSGNVELLVKIVDGRELNGSFWVFLASLTNVAYTVTITDTESGRVRTYENPPNRFQSAGDVAAFPE